MTIHFCRVGTETSRGSDDTQETCRGGDDLGRLLCSSGRRSGSRGATASRILCLVADHVGHPANRAGDKVTHIEFEGGDHYLINYNHRLIFLQETEKFLGECLK